MKKHHLMKWVIIPLLFGIFMFVFYSTQEGFTSNAFLMSFLAAVIFAVFYNVFGTLFRKLFNRREE